MSKKVVVFKDAEEAKWFFHAIYCKRTSDLTTFFIADYVMCMLDRWKPEEWAKELNDYFKRENIPYEVKK